MTAVKTAETIESQTQSVSLYAELPNNAENQRVVAGTSMLDEVAAEAARVANAQTQPAGLHTEVDTMDVVNHHKWLVTASRDWQLQHVKTVGRKDARSGSTTAQTQLLKAQLREVDLKRQARLLDRNRITTPTCCSR